MSLPNKRPCAMKSVVSREPLMGSPVTASPSKKARLGESVPMHAEAGVLADAFICMRNLIQEFLQGL